MKKIILIISFLMLFAPVFAGELYSDSVEEANIINLLAEPESILDFDSEIQQKSLPEDNFVKNEEKSIKNTYNEQTEEKQEKNVPTVENNHFVFNKKEASIYKKQIKNSGLKYNTETFVKQAEANKTSAVFAFLSAGMKPDSTTHSETTPLIWACFHGNYEMVKMLIDAGANVNFVNKDGFSPLHAAVESENTDIVRLLLTQGANVNTATFIDKTTPLHTACYKGNKDIVQILTVAGANVNARDKHNVSPVAMASFYGKKDIVEYLNSNGSNLDINAKDGKILTAAAISNKKTESFDMLIKAGADINEKDENGKTMLIAAVDKSDLKTAAELIKKGADVNSSFNDDFLEEMTPLHIAVCKQDFQMTKLLLKNGAQINLKERTIGATPLQIAVLNGNEDIVANLIYNEADLNAVNSFGNTAADIALAKKDEIMLKKLVSNGALFGKKTGGILASYGCTIEFKQDEGLYYIKYSDALNAVKNFEQDENEEYYAYMKKIGKFHNEKDFSFDKNAFMIYPLLFESMK